MPAHDLLRQAEFPADLTHLVLEQLAERLDQFPRKIRSQAADVVVRLDRDRWPAERRCRFYHVGVQRALHQERDVAPHVFRRLLEYIDEGVTDAPSLLLGIFDIGERLEEARP